MKNFIFYLVCLGFFFPTISAMHNYAHEDTPTARAIAIPKDHQFHGEAPVEAQAELSNNHYTYAKAEALPQATSSHTQPTSTTTTNIHLDTSQAPDAQPTIALAQDLFTKDLFNEHDDQPITIYDAKGNIVSEHFLNADGSEHNTIHNADGSTTTTILDPKKIKQQEITTKPDKSSVIKYYDETGKLEATDVINKDGSKVSTKNSLEGNITDSSIFNKTNELEASMQLDNYGNRRATTFHADNTTTDFIYSPEHTIHNYDDGSTTTSTTDGNGNTTRITKNSDGKLESKEIIKSDGSHEYTQYDSHENIKSITSFTSDAHGDTVGIEKDAQGKILSKITLHVDAQGITIKTIDDAQGNLLEETVYNENNQIMHETIFNSDDTEIRTEFDPSTQKIISKRTTSTDADGNMLSITTNAQGQLIEKGIMKHDGSIEQTTFDPITKKPISISITTIDHATGVSTTIERKPTGQIISKKITDADNNQEETHYDANQKPVAKTVTLANGATITIPIHA